MRGYSSMGGEMQRRVERICRLFREWAVSHHIREGFGGLRTSAFFQRKGSGRMGLSVHDAVSLGFLDGCALLGGQDGLNREIEVVSVMEVPDAYSWVLGGELVLTAFFSVMSEPGKQAQVIETMARKGAAGIVIFYVGTYCQSIDSSLVDKANQLGFPLFQALDVRMAYADVIGPIMAELSLRKLATDISRATHAFDPPSDLSTPRSLLKLLSERLGSTVVLVDSQFVLREKHMPVGGQDARADLIEAWRIKYKYRAQQYYSAMDDIVEIEADSTTAVLLAPIPSGWNKPPDYVLVICKPGVSSDKGRLMFMSVVMSMYKVLFYKEELGTSESPSRNSYITDLLTGKLTSADVIIEKGKSVGLDMQSKRRVFVLGWKTFGPAVDRMCQNLLAQTEHVCFKGHNRLVVLSEPSTVDPDDTHRLRQELLRIWVLSGKPGWDVGFVIGIGSRQPAVEFLLRSYKEACDALRLHRVLSSKLDYYGEPPLVFYESMGWLSMVEELAVNPVHRGSMHTLLAPIREYDEKYGGQLLKTMLVYLWEGCSITKSASRLHVHRNTLNYRLRKIRDLLSEDPFGRGNMLKYWLAVGVNLLDPTLTGFEVL